MSYFGEGHVYSASADRRRFITLDRNLESYVGVIGVGVINGWVPSSSSGLELYISVGDGLINGYYSESGWIVKKREEVIPSDNVLEESYYVDSETGQIYDKVEYANYITVPDNSDVYLYAYRNSNYVSVNPYLEPDNESPVVEIAIQSEPIKTAVGFDYTSTLGSASQSGRVFVGQIVARNGSIVEINTDDVRSLSKLTGSLREYAEDIIKGHKHGGDGQFDPPAIRLQTDRRDMVLSSVSGDTSVFVSTNSETTTQGLDHYHTYSIDDDGNGITVNTNGADDWHFHDISGFEVGDVKGNDSIDAHTHEISLQEEDGDGWTISDPVQIYINGDPYYGDNATVDASSKSVTFDGDVTVKFRTYEIDYDGWVFRKSERSLYRFMLSAAIAYGNEFEQNIIVPDPSTPITVLREQCIPGETRLVNEGDTFLFVPDAANNVTVTLVEEAFVDTVEIEILTNSEVTGRLPEDNILYIPASKIVSGVFEPEIIPMISHLGRFLEDCSPRPTRMRSSDGRVYESERDDIAGNVKLVHSMADDGQGNYIIGTSDGVYRKTSIGSFMYIINGVTIMVDAGEIRTTMEEAALRYQAKTGVSVIIDSTYNDQILLAERAVTAVGDYYSFIGRRNESINGFDEILLLYVDLYKLPEYGYETLRFAGEILDGEEIVREIPQEVDEDSEEEVIPLYLVRNDFHKWTPKKIFVEKNLSSGYDGQTSEKVYSVSSYGIFNSKSVDREWRILGGSGIGGYIYDFAKSYAGDMVAVTSEGIKISVNSSGTAFRHAKQPVFGNDATCVVMGYGNRIISSVGSTIIISDDYGLTWTTFNVADSTVVNLFSDNSTDTTDIVTGHSHDVLVNAKGDGQTSEDDGHYHMIVNGVVSEQAGHTHSVTRNFYAMLESGTILISTDSGSSWLSLTSIPLGYSEFGIPFAAFGNVYVPVQDGILRYSSGSWELTRPIDGIVYSSQWSYSNETVLLGTVNSMYSFDGSSAVQVFSSTGRPVPKIYIDNVPKKFGFVMNNAYNSYDMGGRIMFGSNLDIVDTFNQFYPELGGWSDGIEYDLYLNDRLLKSTRKGIDRSSGTYVDVSNESVINFSVSSTLSSEISIGDTEISVADATNFPDSGIISILYAKKDGQLFADRKFYDYYAKSGNNLLLESPSIYVADSGLEVSYSTEIGGDDTVKITVYDGILDNVGKNTHQDIEDSLSMENTGFPRRLADVYNSNLLHLTIAAKYIYSEIDSEMEDMFVTLFDYSLDPSDENYIGKYIDTERSDIASLSRYSVDGPLERSSAIRRVVKGFGEFSGYIFVASNIGLFKSISYETDWLLIDVDGSSEAYDILQYTTDTILVATDKGMYVNDDNTLISWTKFNENKIGGVPRRIVPRWGPLIDEEVGIDYWWGDWSGVVHQNESLINTIIVSGDGFISYSDDRGVSWLDGKLYDTSGSLVKDMSPVSYTLLKNGSIAMCAKSIDGGLWGVYTSTGTGARWNEIHSVSSASGTISSKSVGDNLNVTMEVVFSSGSPSDQSLVGRIMIVGSDSYVVVGNMGNEVTVFGDSIIDSEYELFNILPYNINILYEDSQKRMSLGSSVGMLYDNGSFFGSERRRDGSIVSVGNRATVNSINISGRVDSVIPLSENSVLTAVVDKHVVKDELKGMIMNFSSGSVPEIEILSNPAGRHDGTVSLTVSGDVSSIVNGDVFVAAGEDIIRAYVTYDGVIDDGDLDGGYIVISPEEYDYGVAREDYSIMKIVANTERYIDISKSFEGPDEGVDPIALIVPGVSLVASNSDGKVPVNVRFDSQRGMNDVRGKYMSVLGSEAFPSGASVEILGNDEISVLIQESYSLADSTYSVFNTLVAGEEFYLTLLSFVPRSSFNNKLSSVNKGHYHDFVPIDGPITGTVSSFGLVTSYSVEMNLSGAKNIDNPIIDENPEIFAGDTLIAYRKDNYSVKYRIVVRSVNASSGSITVSRESEVFDFIGDDQNKIGAGYAIVLNTEGYGSTSTTFFTRDFVVDTHALSQDALIGSESILVSSTDGIAPGIALNVIDDTGVSSRSSVISVSGSEVFLSEPLTADFYTYSSARVEVFYGNGFVSEASIASDVSQGDILIVVDDPSGVFAGDLVEIYDGSGRSDSHVVSSVLGSVINLETAIGTDYLSGSTARFVRKNYVGGHSHIIRRGEFDLYDDGGSRHGHYIAPLMQEVIDMRSNNGTLYVVGSGSVIYFSSDNGESWVDRVDLSIYPEFNPTPSYINGIYPMDSSTVICSASPGYLVYQSSDYVRYSGS
jgi:hypothetical protein